MGSQRAKYMKRVLKIRPVDKAPAALLSAPALNSLLIFNGRPSVSRASRTQRGRLRRTVPRHHTILAVLVET